ncbi:MAG: TetR/AcrR family transcriptional regulator [Propionibacteriaceae bacterium]|nr:TetR/AcrR family transcriptional regulator [Propionibacteriaceae bacterium]
MSRATPMAPEERRQAIIEATLPLILERGTDLSTREIATAAGVAEGTIFRAFETKAELIVAAMHAALSAQDALHRLETLPAGQTLDDRVAGILEVLLAEIQRTRSLTAELSNPELHGPRHHDGRACPPFRHRERHAKLVNAVEAALAGHSIGLAVPPRTAAQVLLAMAFATSLDITDNNTLAQPRNLAEVVLHGLAKGNA